MSTVIYNLKLFNRKERFFLVGDALGNSDFRLSDDFRSKLGKAFGICPPSDAFVAIDYHLDWIYTSLFCALPENRDTVIHPNTEKGVSGNMEDVDLLVAFQKGDDTHLLLVEAKAATGWTNKQARSKADRLLRIFGSDGAKYPHVRPYFGLTSPRCPTRRLKSDEWPSWMTRDGRPIWFLLEMPLGRRKPTRCDSNGKASEDGDYFRVDPCN